MFKKRLRKYILGNIVLKSASDFLLIRIKYVRRKIQNLFVPKDFLHNVYIDNSKNVLIEISIPESAKFLRFDIGMSHNAPHTAKWLEDRNDLFVIGVEANKFNVYSLLKKGVWYKSSSRKKIQHDNLEILYCAIDNVESPMFSKFYNVGRDPGTSSLLRPTDNLLKKYKYKVSSISYVPTIPLHLIFNEISINQFEQIELLKIDTQGKDLEVLKSAGEYLKLINYVQVEVSTFGQYDNASNPEEIYRYLNQMGFYEDKIIETYENQPVDVLFKNTRYPEFCL